MKNHEKDGTLDPAELKFPAAPLKKGTWVAYEFDVWMLKEDEGKDGHVNISNATIQTWINVRENCFPLTLRARAISNYFEHYEDALRDKTRNVNINWPDIHRYYVEVWRAAMRAPNNENLIKLQDKVRDFNAEVQLQLENVKTVDGVRLFR